MTPWLLEWNIHINIVMILQNLFIMLCLFSESDQLKLPQHYCHRGVTFVVTLSWFRCRHHGVAFAFVMVSLLPLWCCLRVGCSFVIAIVVSTSRWSQFCHCHHGVAFIVASSRCHYRSCVVVVPLLSHCRGFIVAVVVLPLSLHCHGFVIAIGVSPLCQSWFHHCHCSVAFVIASSQCCHCSHVIVVPLLSHCCGFVIAIAVLPSSSHCHSVCRHFIIAIVVLPLSLHCHSVVIVVLLSWFCCCHCGVAFAVTSSQFCCRLTVSSLQSHRCIIVVMVMVMVMLWLWSLWLWLWSHCGHCHHCCVIVVVVVALWLLLLRLLLRCGCCCVVVVGTCKAPVGFAARREQSGCSKSSR